MVSFLWSLWKPSFHYFEMYIQRFAKVHEYEARHHSVTLQLSDQVSSSIAINITWLLGSIYYNLILSFNNTERGNVILITQQTPHTIC